MSIVVNGDDKSYILAGLTEVFSVLLHVSVSLWLVQHERPGRPIQQIVMPGGRQQGMRHRGQSVYSIGALIKQI